MTSIEILDSFEGRLIYNMVLDLGDSALGFEQKADLAIQRLAARNPTRTKLYIKWRSHFFKGVTFVDEKLPLTLDIDPSLVPKNCQIEQIAIQQTTSQVNDNGPILVINNDLWRALSNEQKTILILHEIIYHEADLRGNSAKPVRYFNQLILSNRVQQLGDYLYFELLNKLGFSQWDVHGVSVFLDSYLAPYKIFADQDYIYQGSILHLAKYSEVSFDKDGQLSTAHPSGDYVLQTSIGPLKLTGKFNVYNGNLIGYLAENSIIDAKNDWSVPCIKGAKVFIDSNVLSICSEMTVGETLQGPGTRLKIIHSGPYELSKNGKLIFSGSEFSGLYTIGVNQLYFSSLKSSVGILSQPSRIQALNTNVIAVAKIEISEYREFYISSFQPQSDFNLVVANIEFPVASQIKCRYGNKVIEARVKIDPEQYLSGFILSRNWRVPYGPYSGQTIPLGTELTDVSNGITVGKNVCDI